MIYVVYHHHRYLQCLPFEKVNIILIKTFLTKLEHSFLSSNNWRNCFFINIITTVKIWQNMIALSVNVLSNSRRQILLNDSVLEITNKYVINLEKYRCTLLLQKRFKFLSYNQIKWLFFEFTHTHINYGNIPWVSNYKTKITTLYSH